MKLMVLVSSLLLALAYSQEETGLITCSSDFGVPRTCTVPSRKGIKQLSVRVQISAVPCLSGRNYFASYYGVIVTGGCAATFYYRTHTSSTTRRYYYATYNCSNAGPGPRVCTIRNYRDGGKLVYQYPTYKTKSLCIPDVSYYFYGARLVVYKGCYGYFVYRAYKS